MGHFVETFVALTRLAYITQQKNAKPSAVEKQVAIVRSAVMQEAKSWFPELDEDSSKPPQAETDPMAALERYTSYGLREHYAGKVIVNRARKWILAGSGPV